MPDIGLILASARTHSNSAGLSRWLQSLIPSSLSTSPVDPFSPVYPASVLTSPTMPALAAPPNYDTPQTREWSAFITSCRSIAILTPQYNWGIPGGLKNALDHLYWEWKGKPVLLVTYGSRGGGKCFTQLKEVVEGGLQMKFVGGVQVSLPREYVNGEKRVGEGEDGFLEQYEEAVRDAIQKLKAATEEGREE